MDVMKNKELLEHNQIYVLDKVLKVPRFFSEPHLLKEEVGT